MPSIGRFRYLESPPHGPERRGTLVLLHAFPINARMWEPQFALSADGWRVIAPQFRGFDEDGKSDVPPASIDEYAADVEELLTALEVDRAVIGGLSMGGYVAFALFRRAPQYFQGLMLADTRPQADAPAALQSRRQMLEVLSHKGVPAVAEDMLPKLLGDTTRREHPALAERVRKLMLSNSPGGVEAAIRSMMSRPDSQPLLSQIRVPTLIIVGEEDTLTPPQLSDGMQRAIAGSELTTIPKAGHLSNLEQPDAFTAALARFLRHRV
jgi:3-oxoadipate enol-lactonase